jgi:hypothetical protein
MCVVFFKKIRGKKNVLSHAATRMTLTDIMLRERSQTEKSTYSTSVYIKLTDNVPN